MGWRLYNCYSIAVGKAPAHSSFFTFHSSLFVLHFLSDAFCYYLKLLVAQFQLGV